MFEKKCQVCGKIFPEGTSPARKYCDECAAEAHAERRRERNNLRKITGEKPKPRNPETAKQKADREYCSKCIYQGSIRDGGMTCDYILLVGHRRGCKPGAGCEKRALEGQKKRERCGKLYEGTSLTHLCADCRRDARIENIKRVNAKRWGNKE